MINIYGRFFVWGHIHIGGGKTSYGAGNDSIKTNEGLWIRNRSVWTEGWYWAEAPINWFEGCNEFEEMVWFNEHGRRLVEDTRGDKEGFDYLGDTIADTVMAALLGNMVSVEGMEAECVDLLPTVACGAIVWAEEFQVKFALDENSKDVIGKAVSGIAAGHAYDGIGCLGDQDVRKEELEERVSNAPGRCFAFF